MLCALRAGCRSFLRTLLFLRTPGSTRVKPGACFVMNPFYSFASGSGGRRGAIGEDWMIEVLVIA